MTLSDRSRTTIYQALEPLLGGDATEDMLSNFPARDVDAPATQAFVHAEIATMKLGFAQLRTEFAVLRTEFAEFKTEMRTEMADFKIQMVREISELKDDVHTQLRSQMRWMIGLMLTFLTLQVAIITALVR